MHYSGTEPTPIWKKKKQNKNGVFFSMQITKYSKVLIFEDNEILKYPACNKWDEIDCYLRSEIYISMCHVDTWNHQQFQIIGQTSIMFSKKKKKKRNIFGWRQPLLPCRSASWGLKRNCSPYNFIQMFSSIILFCKQHRWCALACWWLIFAGTDVVYLSMLLIIFFY